ncbi:C-type lectin protein [Apiospora aurea]|uniref:C-type lectin protein n=1 Tax=Apiospora aurea TaxID=335848 RepID=A0ABR1QPX8_9PEZI
MAILSPNIRPPPGIPRPDSAGMARDAASRRIENQWFRIPEQELTIGHEDPESDDGPDRYFAWDNEREPYDVKTPAFEAQARPVSVGEFAAFLVDTGKTDAIPATWVKLRNTQGGETTTSRLSSTESDVHGRAKGHTKNKNGDPDGDTALQVFIAQHGIRTVWGPIPLSQAADWPATASWNEVTSYAEWRGGGARLPTLHEVRSIHEHAARLKKSQQPPTTTATESQSPLPGPPTNSRQNKTMHTDPGSIFVDLSGANVGLQNFHPVPVTHRGDHLCGLGDLGGAWEWTSTVFAPQPKFRPMNIYPGYSADFMDGKHMAITGGSWALPPRIAGRKSL